VTATANTSHVQAGCSTDTQCIVSPTRVHDEDPIATATTPDLVREFARIKVKGATADVTVDDLTRQHRVVDVLRARGVLD
jgi:hypothetical protein